MNRRISSIGVGKHTSPPRLTRISPTILTASAVALTLAGLALVAASPLALRSLAAATPEVNWQQLSNVGQTYGAVSALLVVLGLAGVAVTVALQVREARYSRIQGGRNRQHELMRIALDDPVILRFWHGGAEDVTLEEEKVSIYLNLLIQYWLLLWEYKDVDELELRNLMAASLFESDIARRFWRKYHRSKFETSARDRRGARFYKIFDEEYQRAVVAADSLDSARNLEQYSGSVERSPEAAVRFIATGMAAGGLVVYAIMRRFSRSLTGREC